MRNSRRARRAVCPFLIVFLLSCRCGGGGDEAPQVVLQGAAGQELATVEVEIADDAAERSQGLMNRGSLGENAGMLFIFPADTRSSFWMKNTLIPLDIIFIDSAGSVVDIIENATPLSETLLTPDADYRYVLEVNGGFAAAHGIQAGARVQLP